MEEESYTVEEHPEGCSCGCDDLESEDYLKEEEDTMKEEAKAKAQSYVDKGLEHMEDGLKSAGAAAGKVAGKAAWFFMKPLDQVHKHLIEPFTDSFKKEFTNGK